MLSQFVEYFRSRHRDCDCCDHNIDIAALLENGDETKEHQTMKRRLQKFLSSWRWKESKEKNQKRQPTTKKTGEGRFKQLYRRVRRMGKKRGFEVRRKRAREATNVATVADKHADPLRSAVRQLLSTMFADIVENDRTLAKQTGTTTQCFLVYLLSDLDPNGLFLCQYTHPTPQMFNMDFNLGLSFVSSWLQNSLTKIKASYAEGDATLQMPFVVLETLYAGARARARALQRQYPDEKVGIATLDFEALKSAKLVVSTEHTFDFLRVSREGFACGGKLLAWAESNEANSNKDVQPAPAFRDAVLTIMEWKEDGEDTSAENEEVAGDADEESTASQTPLRGVESERRWSNWAELPKKDSGVTSRTASGISQNGRLNSENLSAVEDKPAPERSEGEMLGSVDLSAVEDTELARFVTW